MAIIDLTNKCALITGGTKGIGLACALQLAEAGAQLYLTHRWGSADLDQIYRLFENSGALKPGIIEADVSIDGDTDRLLSEISRNHDKIDIFISNASIAQLTMNLEEYKKRSFFKTLEYSSWPLVEYTRRIGAFFGHFPAYIIGISSLGPDQFYTGYDFVAASKALLEIFARYLSVHLFEKGSRVNVIRFGPVKTESFDLVFGNDFFDFIKEKGFLDDVILSYKDCGKAVLALCSGLMDAMNGQIITIDNGIVFRDNIIMQYLEAKKKDSSGK
jgi:NAD(P)-dependent dehydrogenase (short-subunit alcohol dehydrogenase family)